MLDNLRLEGRAVGPHALTVSCVPSFATKWLAPRLIEFQASHPKMELRVVADETLVDLRRDRIIDVALRYGPGPYGEELHARRLWPRGAIIAICAPAVAKDAVAAVAGRPCAAHADPHRDAGLANAVQAQPSGLGMGSLVRRCWRRHRRRDPQGAGRALFQRQPARDRGGDRGQGHRPGAVILVARDIASGRLVRLFATSIADRNAYWVLCRADRAREARIRTFIKWLLAEAARA